MPVFNEREIRRIDGTLLLVFLGLLRTGKAVEVAAELGVTNSSISHALRRLRDIFGDELFLRRPHGLEATAFAREIAPDIRAALEALQASLSGPASFDIAAASAHIRLSARDSEIAATLPRVLPAIRAKAPGLTFSLRSMSASDAIQELREARIDLALGFFARRDADLDAQLIRTESYLVVAREDHPLLQEALTLERYAAAEHVLVSVDGSMRGIVDTRLAQDGLRRRVVLAVPQFLPALALVAASDAIATLPRTLVLQHARRFGLAIAEPPMDIRAFDLRLVSHVRNRRNTVLNWCTQQFLTQLRDTAIA